MITEPRADVHQAWVFRSPDRSETRRDGPLAGLEFGVKDIIDVAGMPTAYGVDFATRIAERDAWCVAALRAAGAVPAGKTHTTPFAFRDPAVTRNPRHAERTPGGSSAGSAAAVCAGDVPLALGTQTIGSVLRPAAYCGVVGYKPTYGRIPVYGVAPLAPSLDTIGFLARDVATARRAAETLFELEPASNGKSARLGLALDYMHAIIEPQTRSAIERAVTRLRAAGLEIAATPLPACIEETPEHLARLQSHEAYIALARWLDGKPVPPNFAKMLAEGSTVDLAAYRAERAWRETQRPRVAAIFENVSAIIAPAANLAPDRATTGDTRPLGPWTFFGLPAIALPIGDDETTGLPFSMQVVGPPGTDGRLLGIAAAIEAALSG
ncbi:MAG: amidase [Candidatus Eremiobacteraeota bacterium]|nr:amidase [Candidatus Eremiobacteraeota bacterium]